MKNKNIDFSINVTGEVPQWVHLDKLRTQQVYINILNNAIKFTEEGGQVGLYLMTDDEHAIVQVWDTGCGMSAETGKNIFQKFYQGDTSHATRGNGLGLALVKRVVDIMQGEIAVESAVGQGSTFTVKMRRQ